MALKNDAPFDQYSRQLIVANIINFIRENDRVFKIVDVGGYKGKTQYSLPHDQVTIVDIVDSDDKNYIKASAMNLPMEDLSHDFVVSFDVIEHVNKKDRKQFITECLRIAKRGVIICAPHLTEKNEAAEDKLNNLYKSISGKDHIWLKEHIDNGLSDFADFNDIAKNNGYYTKTIFSNDIELWMLMQAALFTNEKYPEAAIKLIDLNEQYNTQLKLDLITDGANAYRGILIAFKNEKDIIKIERFIESQKTEDQDIKKIDIIYKITDYYLDLVRGIESKYIHKNEELIDTENRLNNVLSSKTWRYTHKLRSIKKTVTTKKDNKNIL